MLSNEYNKPMQMKAFLDEDFLLSTPTAVYLYHTFAKDMPIIDYHNHLPPQQIAENHAFENLTQVWLYGDHYKWRAMRANGVAEAYCTGTKSDWEKFEKWADTVPYTLRNPLYHWTHLELQRYFGITDLLQPNTASAIYQRSNELLQAPSYRTQGLLKQMNVRVVCTTDDPTDSLVHHLTYKEQGHTDLKMLPTFRPDKFILIQAPHFHSVIEKLGEITESPIRDFSDLMQALGQRALFFQSLGCKLADHGLEFIYAAEFTLEAADAVLKKVLRRETITNQEALLYQSAILHELGVMYAELGWTQQFHLGALRNTNLRALRELGPDTGWDSIGDWSQAQNLARYLGRLDEHNQLAKTILYNLNPADNEVIATMIGNFNDGSMAGKIQFGSGWWFLDQKDGMEKQMNALSNMGLISQFIGMLTDSRSFLSFPRHEYFRRILCNMFGKDIENGELPNDLAWTGKIIQQICYHNAQNYFNF